MKGDKARRAAIEAALAIAIKDVLDCHSEGGCYWHPKKLEKRMARAAMLVLKASSAAAKWGHRNL